MLILKENTNWVSSTYKLHVLVKFTPFMAAVEANILDLLSC